MSSTSKDGILAVSGSLLGLSAIAVSLRFYARIHQRQPLKTDDWLVVPAWITYLGSSICIFLLVHNKEFGYPESVTATSENADLTQIALDILSNTTLACTKLSALFFYLRVFATDSSRKGRNWFDILNITTIIVVILWYVVFEFLVGFQCGTHFTSLWTAEYTKYCMISEPFLYGLAVSDFLLEVWILVLPIPSILQLNVSTKKKLSIFGIFLLAFTGIGASIARMVAYIEISLSHGAFLQVHKFELVLTQVFYLTMLEAGMTLVAINLPSLWPLRNSTIPNAVMNSIHSMVSLGSSAGRTNSATRRADEQNEIKVDREFSVEAHGVPNPKPVHATDVEKESSASQHDFGSWEATT